METTQLLEYGNHSGVSFSFLQYKAYKAQVIYNEVEFLETDRQNTGADFVRIKTTVLQ